MEPLAIYVHTPFCPSKCGYCDFNSYAMSGEIMERTTRATIEEILRSPARGRPAKTIFFGGGTPTFLEEGQLVRILEAVFEAHPPLEGCEITSEANPGTVDMPKFRAMRGAGFNRISLGAQSFLDSDLLTLGRVHRSGEIERAVGVARDAGFGNLNLDLMFALPGQSVHAWRRNLERAMALQPEHLSLYCLTIEPNTAFYKQHLRGQLAVPGEESQIEMYDACVAEMEAAGFRQYEISNFAQPGRECRHNLCYWHAEEYAGYGPGAVGRIGERRYTNLKHPDLYCAAVEEGGETAFESETVDEKTLRIEQVMLGLRLNEGVVASLVEQDGLAKADRLGWVERSGDRVRLTTEGRHLHNEVVVELMPL
ncbi:MAG TPA: radical SAM family heme chaperone HemW [Fimbriimonas sp.]